MNKTAPPSGPDRGGSPPTDRVVAVVEFLAAQSEPSSVATIAAHLELNRSTTTAILGALERADWVERHPDLRYALGAGLHGVAEAVRTVLPLPDRTAQVLDDLARRTQCDASLAMVGGSALTFLAVARGYGQVPAGIHVGAHLPLRAPLGTAVMAYRDGTARQDWLDTADPTNRRLLDDALTQVCDAGFVVFGLGEADLEVIGVLTEITQLLAEHPRRSALRQQVYELLAKLAGNPYTATELATAEDLAISYLAAPVFVRSRAVYEVQLGPLQPSVGPANRSVYIDEVKAAAAALST